MEKFVCVRCGKAREQKRIPDDAVCASCRRAINMLSKYGVENPAQLQSVKDKIKSTNLKKYGVDCAAKNRNVRSKMKSTLKEKYDNRLPGQKASHNRFLKDRLKECEEHNLVWLDSDKFRGKYDNAPIQYHFKCEACGNEFIDNFHSLPFPTCRKCSPSWHNTSKAEKEIVEAIRKIYNGKIIENDRSVLDGKELDIYLPEKKLAIEYNGTYWHGYRKGLNVSLEDYLKKHQEKRLLCEAKNIHLITIDELDYDDEVLQYVLDVTLGNDVSKFEEKHHNDLRYFRGAQVKHCMCRGFLHKKIVDVKDLKRFLNRGGILVFDLGYKT